MRETSCCPFLTIIKQMLLKVTCLILNKANPSDAEAPFLDLDLSIKNGIISTKIYDKQDDSILK